MGCDIHLFVERRESSDAPWRPALVYMPCTMCKDGKGNDGKKCYWCKGTCKEAGYSDRNYDTFAILADVRNGRGFAGVRTGEGFVPISEPRGLPRDMSPELCAVRDAIGDDDIYERNKATLGCGWLGDHSHSWLTLAELDACDLTRTTVHYGVVGLRGFKTFIEKGTPDSYAGGVSGRNVRHVSNGAMSELVVCCTFAPSDDRWNDRAGVTIGAISEEAKRALREDGISDSDIKRIQSESNPISLYTQVSWRETYLDASGRFFKVFVPELRKLGTPENVRIVFGFDS